MRSTARRARVGDGGIDRHLVLHRLERAADLGQGDPLHVRAEIAGPHELDAGIAGRRRCRSSSTRSSARPGPAARGRRSRSSPRSSRRNRPRPPPRAGIRDGPARRRRDGRRAAARTSAAVKRSCTSQWPAQVMISTSVSRGDVLRQVLVGQHDHLRHAQALDDLHGVARGAADVGLGLHRGRGVDVGHDRHAGLALAQQAHVRGGDRGGERAAGAQVGDQHASWPD